MSNFGEIRYPLGNACDKIATATGHLSSGNEAAASARRSYEALTKALGEVVSAAQAFKEWHEQATAAYGNYELELDEARGYASSVTTGEHPEAGTLVDMLGALIDEAVADLSQPLFAFTEQVATIYDTVQTANSAIHELPENACSIAPEVAEYHERSVDEAHRLAAELAERFR